MEELLKNKGFTLNQYPEGKFWELTVKDNEDLYEEWSSLKKGDKVRNFTYGTGEIISAVGVGYVVKFDKGEILKITDGRLEKCS